MYQAGYLTLVYQIAAGRRRLLYVARDRTENSLRGFFDYIPESSVILQARVELDEVLRIRREEQLPAFERL